MSRNRIGLFSLVMVLIIVTGCATNSSSAPAAPTSDSRGPQSLPPQPTLPPLTPQPPVPFASPTFAPIVVGSPVAPGTPPTLAPTAAPTRAAATPTQATSSGTATRAEVKLDFVTPLGTAELVDDLRDKLVQIPGILAVSGNETAITVVYNPAVITVDQIKQRMAGVGNPVK